MQKCTDGGTDGGAANATPYGGTGGYGGLGGLPGGSINKVYGTPGANWSNGGNGGSSTIGGGGGGGYGGGGGGSAGGGGGGYFNKVIGTCTSYDILNHGGNANVNGNASGYIQVNITLPSN